MARGKGKNVNGVKRAVTGQRRLETETESVCLSNRGGKMLPEREACVQGVGKVFGLSERRAAVLLDWNKHCIFWAGNELGQE